MPAFRNIPHSRHSGRTARNIPDLCDSDSRPFPSAYRRTVKREPVEATIPPLAPSSPPTFPTVSSPISRPISVSRPPSTPSARSKSPSSRNKKSHARQREPGYVPRPRNAFIVFRSYWIDQHKESGEGQQNELSKQAGKAWNKMSPSEKQKYREIATEEQKIHKIEHPNYQYTPGPRRSNSRAKSTKTPTRRASGASAASRRRSLLEEETWSISSRSSAESDSPEFVPTTARFPRAPRVAAQIAAQRLRTAASMSPSPHPRTPEISSPVRQHLSVNEIDSRDSDASIKEEYVPTDEIPVLELDPRPPTTDAKLDEPEYVTELPPSMAHSGDHFGMIRYHNDYYSHFSTMSNISMSVSEQMHFDYSMQLTPRASSPLELYSFSPEGVMLNVADQWQTHHHHVDDTIASFEDFSSWIHSSPSGGATPAAGISY